MKGFYLGTWAKEDNRQKKGEGTGVAGQSDKETSR